MGLHPKLTAKVSEQVTSSTLATIISENVAVSGDYGRERRHSPGASATYRRL